MPKLLNPLFIFHLIFVALVLIGEIPRELVIYETGLLVLYFLFASIEDGLIFLFVQFRFYRHPADRELRQPQSMADSGNYFIRQMAVHSGDLALPELG